MKNNRIKQQIVFIGLLFSSLTCCVQALSIPSGTDVKASIVAVASTLGAITIANNLVDKPLAEYEKYEENLSDEIPPHVKSQGLPICDNYEDRMLSASLWLGLASLYTSSYISSYGKNNKHSIAESILVPSAVFGTLISLLMSCGGFQHPNKISKDEFSYRRIIEIYAGGWDEYIDIRNFVKIKKNEMLSSAMWTIVPCIWAVNILRRSLAWGSNGPRVNSSDIKGALIEVAYCGLLSALNAICLKRSGDSLVALSRKFNKAPIPKKGWLSSLLG